MINEAYGNWKFKIDKKNRMNLFAKTGIVEGDELIAFDNGRYIEMTNCCDFNAIIESLNKKIDESLNEGNEEKYNFLIKKRDQILFSVIFKGTVDSHRRILSNKLPKEGVLKVVGAGRSIYFIEDENNKIIRNNF